MPWPFTTSSDESTTPATGWRRYISQRRPTVWDPATWTHPTVLIPTLILTSTLLTLSSFRRNYLTRFPTAAHIPHSHFHSRTRSILGRVASVGDGDNLRVYHTPGGRLLGWGWLPGRKVPTAKKDLRDQTIHVRIAGVDAPEGAHFGKVGQPGAEKARLWLEDYTIGRRVRVWVYRRDQYERVVGSVKMWRGLWRRDVGLQMMRAGWAMVYEAKYGAEFGGLRARYERAERWARAKRLGMWKQKKVDFVSPAAYKKEIRDGVETTESASVVTKAASKVSAAASAAASKLSTRAFSTRKDGGAAAAKASTKSIAATKTCKGTMSKQTSNKATTRTTK